MEADHALLQRELTELKGRTEQLQADNARCRRDLSRSEQEISVVREESASFSCALASFRLLSSRSMG
jgi:FtsZ-binding cell division protein ZapB